MVWKSGCCVAGLKAESESAGSVVEVGVLGEKSSSVNWWRGRMTELRIQSGRLEAMSWTGTMPLSMLIQDRSMGWLELLLGSCSVSGSGVEEDFEAGLG